jgi:hypothetical protein
MYVSFGMILDESKYVAGSTIYIYAHIEPIKNV